MLETDFEVADGAVRVIDFMPRRGSGPPRVMRIVKGLRGTVPMRMDLALRPDYGSITPWVDAAADGIVLACMEPAAEALLETVVSAVAAAPDAPGALRAGIHAFFAFLDADGEAWRLLHDETLPAGGEIATRVNAYRARMEALVTALRSTRRAAPSSRWRWRSSAPPRRSGAGG